MSFFDLLSGAPGAVGSPKPDSGGSTPPPGAKVVRKASAVYHGRAIARPGELIACACGWREATVAAMLRHLANPDVPVWRYVEPLEPAYYERRDWICVHCYELCKHYGHGLCQHCYNVGRTIRRREEREEKKAA